ncbi:MAG: hypothetical protein WEF50_22840 [Myxococcota bacterium]
MALALLVAGCASPAPRAADPNRLRAPDTRIFRAPDVGGEGERYSAWFADERDGVIYFGLSPFWTALWATGDPSADLRVPGPHLIGRFELASETFLPPLEVRATAPDVRSSVWDVLAHPNGWIYYTTFFEGMGRVHPETGQVETFPALGLGLNELALGPNGRIYVTRYGSGLAEPGQRGDGAIVVTSESGLLLREVPLHARDGAVTAVKSIAVDPSSGRAIANADVIGSDGRVAFARFWLGRDLSLVGAPIFEPELLFVAFAPDGRMYAVEDESGHLQLELRGGVRVAETLDLGERHDSDFAQDIQIAADGTAAIAFWSGRVELVRERDGRVERASLVLEKPADCGPPPGRSLVYSAFTTETDVFATLFCGVTILRAPLPTVWSRIAPGG